MFCANCGHPIPDGAGFCENCGAAVGKAAAEPSEPAGHEPIDQTQQPAGNFESGDQIAGQKVTENIYLCPDGKYRWIYDFEMLKNPTIMITVMKVMTLSFGIVLGFMILVNLIGGDFRYWDSSDYISFFGGLLILYLVILALSALSYVILASAYGWSYLVLLTMDEDGVELKQMKKEFQKAQAIGWLAVVAGLAAGNPGAAGAGMLAATRDSSYSVFQNVRKVKAVRRRHVIYVNQLLGHNQVYAEDADFDFVRDYIVKHCPNATIQG